MIVEVCTIAKYMLGCFKAIYFPFLVTMFHYFSTIFAIFVISLFGSSHVIGEVVMV